MEEHTHDHESDHTHDEVDPMVEAYRPPAEELLVSLREQWLADRASLTNAHEQLIVARSTIEFQNRVIASLQNQLRAAEGTNEE